MRHYELKFEYRTLRFIGLNSPIIFQSLGYFYNPKENKIIQFPIVDNLDFLRHFNDLTHHIGLVSRKEKFLKVYCLLELLGGKPQTSWRAVRVSISHSSKKITEPKLVNYLLKNFGGLNINLKKYRYNKLFYELFTELVEETYQRILCLLRYSKVIQPDWSYEIIEILDSLRLRNFERSNKSRLYYYKELNSKIIKHIPVRCYVSSILQLIEQSKKNNKDSSRG